MVQRLATDRLNAIRDGRSIRSITNSANDGVSMETIKAKIDAEIKAAKESGLNFNIVCHLWLFDVGIESEDTGGYTGLAVSKFLNRCLGLRMNKQRLMTDYFMKHLEKEIYAAKSVGELPIFSMINVGQPLSNLFIFTSTSGSYDVGILQLRGNKVAFADRPRTFCFRGLSEKDERVYVYRVSIDKGVSLETAMELYNEAKETEHPQPASRNGWLGRGVRADIKSGFYVDDRPYLRGGKKVFLVINPGPQSHYCVVVRPNTGRTTLSKDIIRNTNLGQNKWRLELNVDRATAIWERE
jgi:hypothetical protein